jgi:hypothetical protein
MRMIVQLNKRGHIMELSVCFFSMHYQSYDVEVYLCVYSFVIGVLIM